MPKVSDDYLDRRRQQVLDAAMRCFARRGFAGTTMKDIASEAGVSYGVVYHYFDSKDELIALGNAAAETRRQKRFEQAERKESAVEAAAEYLRLSLGRWSGPERGEIALRLQIIAESAINEDVRAVTGAGAMRGRGQMTELLRRGQASGEIDPALDPVATAAMLLALNEGLVVLKALDPELDARAYLAAVERLVRIALVPGDETGGGS